MRPTATICAALAAGSMLFLGPQAGAQTPAAVNTFARVAPGVNAAIWRPGPGTPSKPGVVVIIMHDESSVLDHLAGPNLARRGYTVIAANPRTAPDSGDRDTDWDNDLVDVGQVVRYARALPGTAKVVLIGHSSGAPMMSAYQAIAENGPAWCQGAEKLSKCPDRLAGMPKADGLVLLDPIFGVGANVLTSIDPAVVDAARPRALDPKLDSFNPANGYSKTGATYPAGFRKAYFAAQARRNNRTIDQALARRAEIEAGRGQFADDEPIVVPGANRRPRLFPADLGLLSHTRAAWPVLHADGSTSNEVVRSVRRPSGLQPTTLSLGEGALSTTVRRYLSTFATRAGPDYAVGEDGVTGIDWTSSYTNTPNNVTGVAAPLLVMGMTGHYWLVSSELAYQRAKSVDKSLAFVEGATHGFTPCEPCARTPGQFGDTVALTFDYVAGWIGKRF